MGGRASVWRGVPLWRLLEHSLPGDRNVKRKGRFALDISYDTLYTRFISYVEVAFMGRNIDAPIMCYIDRGDKDALDEILRREGLSISAFLRGVVQRKIKDTELLGAPLRVFNVSIEERGQKWAAWISPMGVVVYADSMQRVVAQVADAVDFAMANSGGRNDVV